MKIIIFKIICASVWASIWFSTNAAAGNFETLIDGYSSNKFPLVKLPWLSNQQYLESSVPDGLRIFTKKENYRIKDLTRYQRYDPEVKLYFYKSQLCEVAYIFRGPPDTCLNNFSLCDELGGQLQLIIKRYGTGKTKNESLVIWPLGYEVERRRLWSVDNVKIGLYEMTGLAATVLMARHVHLSQAIYAAQQKYLRIKVKATVD
jgi:hypothetical protein